MAASAVTAAVLPEKSEGKRVNNGTLRANSNTVGGPNGVVSCFDDVDTVDSCTATASITTGSGQDDSTVNGLQPREYFLKLLLSQVSRIAFWFNPLFSRFFNREI